MSSKLMLQCKSRVSNDFTSLLIHDIHTITCTVPDGIDQSVNECVS